MLALGPAGSPSRPDIVAQSQGTNKHQRRCIAGDGLLTATIDREAWGLSWNVALEAGGWLVSKDVKLVIDVAADEVAVTADQPVLAGAAA